MDTLRGNFGSAYDAEDRDYGLGDELSHDEPPPPEIGTDERRMQVRAYNHWASLLEDRNFPSVEDLEPEKLPDFGPYSVLLDFTNGIDDPAVQYLGNELAGECDANSGISKLSDVPARSLLSRITDHYMQILANQAPIGFEAEFVNQRGATILYRGILLPFSSDDDTIDFIYGVINWKQMADQMTADELLLEIDQALEDSVGEEDDGDPEVEARDPDPVTDWADGPGTEPEDAITAANDAAGNDEAEWDEDMSEDNPFDGALPRPSFGLLSDAGDSDFTDEGEEEDEEDDDLPGIPENFLARVRKREPILPPPTAEEYAAAAQDQSEWADMPAATDDQLSPPIPTAYEPPAEEESFVPAPVVVEAVESDPLELAELAADEVTQAPAPAPVAGDEGLGLYDCLADARELAQVAQHSEDRSRTALYAAVGRAYDFSLAAEEAPEEFGELIEENGLSVQERAPMTPVVKLVFGADYDKTRLTEYAAVLSHAHRTGIARGTLASFLREAEGGLKGVVQAERRLRREEAGKPVEDTNGVRAALAKKLRTLEPIDLDTLDDEGPEFALVMIRRLPSGELVVLGEVPEDVPLLEKAARKLVA